MSATSPMWVCSVTEYFLIITKGYLGDHMILAELDNDAEVIHRASDTTTNIMFTPARDFLLETPWRIISLIQMSTVIPFDLDNQKRCEPFILCNCQA
jgi:hypothetical protein